MRNRDGVRVHHEKERRGGDITMRRSDGVNVHHEK